MDTKAQKIRNALLSGDEITAVKIASKFFDKSEVTSQCKDAASAMLNPSFYRQIGKDPEIIINNAVASLKDKFLDGSTK